MTMFSAPRNSVDIARSAGYKVIAAGQTTAAVGKTISRIIIVPETTSPGQVLLGTDVLFVGGATSVSSLAPISLSLFTQKNTPFTITTGTNVHVIVFE
jgi:hypothetical protein